MAVVLPFERKTSLPQLSPDDAEQIRLDIALLESAIEHVEAMSPRLLARLWQYCVVRELVSLRDLGKKVE